MNIRSPAPILCPTYRKGLLWQLTGEQEVAKRIRARGGKPKQLLSASKRSPIRYHCILLSHRPSTWQPYLLIFPEIASSLHQLVSLMKTTVQLVIRKERWCTAMVVLERFTFGAWIHRWKPQIFLRETVGGFAPVVLFARYV